MKSIDLRSDTVTLPPEAMRKAMYAAELGDDVYGEDPTVNKLQENSARLMGQEAGLFVPTGTMGNFIALLCHVGRGEEAIVGLQSHIFHHEQGNASTLGAIHLKPLQNEGDGTISLADIKLAVSPDDDHYARTRLLALENAFNGSVIKKDYLNRFWQLAAELALKTHLDGARIFNASLALGISTADLASPFDSVQFCFSKGLSAPGGSMLCGSKAFIKEARRWRKALGGGMRQVGVLAAACQYALDHMVDRLSEDHENARLLAEKINVLDGIDVNWLRADTNMVWFDVNLEDVSAAQFATELNNEGLKVFDEGPKSIRAVTHYGITKDDVLSAAEIIARVHKSCCKPSRLPAGAER